MTEHKVGAGLRQRTLRFGSDFKVSVLCRGVNATSELLISGDTDNSGYETQEFDAIAESATDDTGLDLWAAAVRVLCDYLVARKDRVRGRVVCELGAGVGAAGLLCGLLGAKSVAITDGDDAVLPTIARNIALNNLGQVCQCRKLSWGPRSALIDPAKPGAVDSLSRFDLLVGADLAYFASSVPLLLATLRRHLRPDSGLFLLGHEVRRSVKFGPDREPVVEDSDSVLDALLAACQPFEADSADAAAPASSAAAAAVSAATAAAARDSGSVERKAVKRKGDGDDDTDSRPAKRARVDAENDSDRNGESSSESLDVSLSAPLFWRLLVQEKTGDTSPARLYAFALNRDVLKSL